MAVAYQVKVITKIGMTLRAVGLACIPRLEAIPPKGVLPTGNGLYMCGIQTGGSFT